MLAQAISGYMSITGFPDGPPTRSGQSISDYYAGMLCAFSIVSALHYRDRTRQGPAHRHRAARQPGRRARQPRRALHGRRRAAHARRQRLVRRLELRRLSDDRRPRGRRGRARATRCGGASARSSAAPTSRAIPASPPPPRGATAATRSPAIIQGWTQRALQGRGRGRAGDGRRAGGARQQRRRDGRRSRRCRRARCSSSVDHPIYGPLKTTGTPLKLSETPGRIALARPAAGRAQRGGLRRAARPLAATTSRAGATEGVI